MKLTIQQDPTIVLDTGHSGRVYAVAFSPDGIHLLGGGEDGVRRWRLPDGPEVGKQTEMTLFAISVSRDQKWIVCGAEEGASVCDGELREKDIEVEGTNSVMAVDVSPDSTRFVTGSRAKEASIWSISSGERLVGPLQHDDFVTGVRFSPDGEHIATACWGTSVRVFDSHSGDEAININTIIPSRGPITPLVWSNDGQQIFATSKDNRIRSFTVSTGSQLAESQILEHGDIQSIALATNGKFLATYGGHTISFLDALTLNWIGPVITDSAMTYSIALSPDSNYVMTGGDEGKIRVHNLGHILPDVYGPFHVSIWPPFCHPH